MRTFDWHLIVLVAGFVLVAPLNEVAGGAATAPLLWLSHLFATDPFAAYNASLAAAALKRPQYQVKLATIDPATPTVNVVTFGPPRPPPASDRKFDMWVALAAEVRDACAGAADPVRTLQQILGLPPVAAPDRVVTEVAVSRDGLFRPCISGGDVAAPTCGFDFPAEPDKTADSETLRDAYEQLRFVTEKMWDAYRIGFLRSGGQPGDYPYTGVPFTGMGWSYDWASSSFTHVGVSEFVIKRDATISVVGTTSPGEFCGKPG